MESEIIEEQIQDTSILITNIKWHMEHQLSNYGKGKQKELPTMVTVTVPETIRTQEEKDYAMFKDNVETFAYNFLTKKYGVEVSFCQIWLYLNENDINS